MTVAVLGGDDTVVTCEVDEEEEDMTLKDEVQIKSNKTSQIEELDNTLLSLVRTNDTRYVATLL